MLRSYGNVLTLVLLTDGRLLACQLRKSSFRPCLVADDVTLSEA